MPGRAMAANAGLLRTRSVRLVLARSVTTTLAPAAAHSFLSLHRTCRGRGVCGRAGSNQNQGWQTRFWFWMMPRRELLPGSRRRSRRRPGTARGSPRRGSRRPWTPPRRRTRRSRLHATQRERTLVRIIKETERGRAIGVRSLPTDGRRRTGEGEGGGVVGGLGVVDAAVAGGGEEREQDEEEERKGGGSGGEADRDGHLPHRAEWVGSSGRSILAWLRGGERGILVLHDCFYTPSQRTRHTVTQQRAPPLSLC